MRKYLPVLMITALSLAACQSTTVPNAPVGKPSARPEITGSKGGESAPVVRWVSKASGLPASNTYLVAGENFTGATEVKVNNTAVTFTVINDNLITLTYSSVLPIAPAIVMTPAGIKVTNAAGSGNLGISYDNLPIVPNIIPNLANAATITSLSATSGAVGSTVVITGTNFTNAVGVSFNTSTASFTVDSPTQITARVPGGAADGKITVLGASGPGSSAENFDVTNKVWFVNASSALPAEIAAVVTLDGGSWSLAYTDLQQAIGAAAAGDEIWVAKGTYKPTSTSDKSISFALKSNVKIYGGFAGTEKDLSARNWQSNATILSADLTGNDNYTDNSSIDQTDNSYHVVSGADNATLDGFTIQGGYANANDDQSLGGGIICKSVSPTLSNLIVTNNLSGAYGGGLYIQGATPTLSNVVFYKNTAGYNGSGAYIQSGGATFSNAVFADNAGNSGNGLNVELGRLNLYNVTFLNNHLRYAGTTAQGAYLYNLLLRNSTLTDAFSGVVEKQGVVTAAADPFTASGDPDGADNLWLTSDDGLRISDFATVVNQGVTGNSVPGTDILGNSRINNPEPGAYESSQVQIP